MRTSETVKELALALVNAQHEIKHATKDSKNPHFRNDYASLESVINASKDALLRFGITVLQGISMDGASLTTRLQHANGEFLETECKLVLSKNDMQGLGSAITYGRRYALAAILNISQADDDGNEASALERKPVNKSKAKATGTEEF